MSDFLIYNKIVVGISGASGFIYGIKLLELLRELKVETHLVITKAAKVTMRYEVLDWTFDQVVSLASYYHNNSDIGALCASGSFLHDGMIVAPCSVRTMSEIATGVTSSLLTRVADVTLKERRKLVLLFRETPLHIGHIQSMAQVTNMGAIIAPPLNAFYCQPSSIDELITHSIARVLDLFNLNCKEVKRWKSGTI